MIASSERSSYGFEGALSWTAPIAGVWMLIGIVLYLVLRSRNPAALERMGEIYGGEALDRCSKRWERMSRSRSHTCRGKRTGLIKRVPVLGRRKVLLMLRPGARAYLRLTLTLPIRAGDALQRQTSTLVYRFTGVAQR